MMGEPLSSRVVRTWTRCASRGMPILEMMARAGLEWPCTQGHNHAGFHDSDFRFQPWQASGNLRGVRFLVQAPLSTLFKFKMFNDIGDVNLLAVNTGLFQCAVQQLTGGPDEWLSLKIFVVPGLLSDEEKMGLPGTLTKYGLSRMLPQITCFTVLCSGLKSTKRARVGFGGFHFVCLRQSDGRRVRGTNSKVLFGTPHPPLRGTLSRRERDLPKHFPSLEVTLEHYRQSPCRNLGHQNCIPTFMSKRIRYAVVGMGHIAQVAVLPAFAHAKRNSELAALVSDDTTKRYELGRKYQVAQTYTYDEYDQCLQQVDAVYIALPNSMHAEYTIRAAKAGVHVLCEKPMAVTASECQKMVKACRDHGVKLMIGYRLHFEEINLDVMDLIRKGRIGRPKYFNSSFSMTVRPGNIRTKSDMGGGTLYDIGIYCINAARYLFGGEPIEVQAMSVNSGVRKLSEIDESTGALMRFENDRVAVFRDQFQCRGRGVLCGGR